MWFFPLLFDQQEGTKGQELKQQIILAAATTSLLEGDFPRHQPWRMSYVQVLYMWTQLDLVDLELEPEALMMDSRDSLPLGSAMDCFAPLAFISLSLHCLVGAPACQFPSSRIPDRWQWQMHMDIMGICRCTYCRPWWQSTLPLQYLQVEPKFSLQYHHWWTPHAWNINLIGGGVKDIEDFIGGPMVL